MSGFSDHIRWFTEESSRFASLVAGLSSDDLDKPVPGCPEWDVAGLVAHLGGVYLWVDEILATTEPAGEPPAPHRTETVEWFGTALSTLRTRLETIDPATLDAPTWNWSGRNKVVRFWPRRMAHETAVHRLDLDDALGIESHPIPFALDTLAEFLDDLAPRWMGRRNPLPAADLHLHCTGAGFGAGVGAVSAADFAGLGEWHLFAGADGSYVATHEHAKAAAALSGSATDLVRAIHRRPHAQVETFGDAAVVDAWVDALTFS